MNREEYEQRDTPLSKEEKKALFQEYAETKDRQLRDILIEEHLYIAEILSKKYVGRGIEYEDIYQVACMGLILAVERYNPDRGFEFSSFATPTIVGEIKKYFRDKGWTIRVPRRIQEQSKKINNAKVTLSQLNQKVPTVGEIADYLDMTEEEVLEVMEASKVYTPQSLDLTYEGNGEDREINFVDLIGEEEEYFSKIELNDFLERVMEKFNEVEKTILIDRYFQKKTQVSIAEKLGISQMTVSRIEKKVLKKLREEVKKQEDF